MVGKYKAYALGTIAFSLLNVAATLYVPVLIGRAVDCLVYKAVGFDFLRKTVCEMGITIAIAALCLWLVTICNNKLTFGIVEDLRNQTFDKFSRLPLRYVDSRQTGDILSRMIADVEQLSDGLLLGFSQLFTGVATIIVTLCFMFSVNIVIAILVVVLTPISLLVARYIAKNTHVFFAKQTKVRAKETVLINEMISNEKVVKAFSREESVIEEFNIINNELKDTSIKAIFYSSLTNPCTRFVNGIVYAMVALAGSLFSIKYGISIGVLTCFLSYANQYTKPFNEISGVITEMTGAIAAGRRVFEFIDECEEVKDCECEPYIDMRNCTVDLENVFFSYDRNKTLIENLNLSVAKGEHIAIVGPTGCGKTTLINLLMRFYDVDSGKISIDSVNIKDMPRRMLRTSYGMVLQDTWLRNKSIRDNLKLGRDDISDEAMIEACKAAHVHSFIRKMKDGYDTVVTEDGSDLSQGQKQLLCIARVMLSVPPMLILDEATSSIDTRTELKIQDAFLKMMKGRTTFIVAHRLATIKNADVILAMKDGNIVEMGKHEELLGKKGFYYKLYNSQFG